MVRSLNRSTHEVNRSQMMITPAEPVFTVELFPGLATELLGVLKSLPPAAWELPTACTGWTVKDVTAHLLGGTLNRLSFGRDRLAHPRLDVLQLDYAALVQVIDQANAAWVATARGLSCPLLVDFLALTDPQLYTYFKSLPPFAASGVAVAWAGEAHSPNWFDIAREYTEKWLHQQHIRQAVNRPLLDGREWLFPVLDTFLRALPHTYRELEAVDGTLIGFHIRGDAGGDWALRRENAGQREGPSWRLYTGEVHQAAAHVRLDQDTAWRLFTRGISPDAARAAVQLEGDESLAQPILQMVSIMA